MENGEKKEEKKLQKLQPTGKSLSHLSKSTEDLQGMAGTTRQPTKQAPPRPPPPKLSPTKYSPLIAVPQAAADSDDSLSPQPCPLELASPVYDTLEAGRSATLPRPLKVLDRPAVPALKRRKSVPLHPMQDWSKAHMQA